MGGDLVKLEVSMELVFENTLGRNKTLSWVIFLLRWVMGEG